MTRTLHVHYIVPSRYDDDGYVHRYWRGVVPSNSLMCLKSLTEDVGSRGELGPEVDVSVSVFDDCVQRPPLKRIIREHRRGKHRVVVGLVGVQSNQFARAADLALELRAAGVPVLIGGFHVSGILAMFDEPTHEVQRVLDAGVTLVKGEVEAPGMMAELLRDALDDRLQPVYAASEPPDLANAPVPRPDKQYLSRFLLKNMATLDTSRGCPFGCSFCTIINVQGRRMRCRSAEAILESIRENYTEGVTQYFFTDDNMSRSHAWEDLFDGMAQLRAEGMNLHFMMQVDTQAYRLPGFVKKAESAGCDTVFVGMETVNPDNLEATGKRQNDAEAYAAMVETWHKAGVRVHVGYIIGLPFDTQESVIRDVELLRDHVQVDEASFFMLTPLPGSQDHYEMHQQGVPIDADVNNYESTHETFRHPNFAPGSWRDTFHAAWKDFYSPENVVNILLRAPRKAYWPLFWTSLWYRWSGVFVRTHPMGTGLFRLKDRKARRPEFPRENVFQYGWRRIKDLAWGTKVYAQLFLEFQEIWMLTRKPDDPRWATLADLRTRWATARQQVMESDLKGRCDVAAQEVRNMLATASERLHALSQERPTIGKQTCKAIQHKAQEVDAYLRSFDMQAPSWATVVSAQQYISNSLLSGYEEVAIHYVARRRQLNEYRKNLLTQLRKGRILSLDLTQAVKLVYLETILAIRFWVTALTHGV